jgi:site-specific DNA-methyltransferase (adenine-specific)
MKITDKITITNEDCMELLKRTDSKSIDLILTDPPYGMDFQSNFRKEKHKKIKGDKDLDWLPDWINEISRVIKDDGHLYIWCSWHKIDIFKVEIEKHFSIKNIIVWAKNGGGMGDLVGGYGGRYELCFFINKGRPLNGRRDTDVIDKAYRTGNEYHPTQKPVNLMEYLIEKSTNQNDIVMDCFSGSGSTAIACHNTKRFFIGSELDSLFYEKSIQIIKNHTSQQTLF